MLRRSLVVLLLVAALGAVGVASWLAGQRTAASAVLSEPTVEPVTVAVELRALSDVAIAPGAVTFPPVATVRGGGGTVTWIAEPGTTVEEGQVVAEVDARPVVVLQGDKPMFRDLVPGTSGDDVTAFHAALERLGTFDRDAATAYDWRSRTAWRALVEEAGYPRGAPDVARHDVVFVPSLPAVVGDVAVVVGEPADGVLLQLVEVTPRVTAVFGPNAAITAGLGATVEGPGLPAPIEARVAAVTRSESELEVELEGELAGLRSGVGLRVTIDLVDAAEVGPVVPASALRSDAAGRVAVTVVRDGDEHDVPVTVVGTAGTEVGVAGDLHEGDEVIVDR